MEFWNQGMMDMLKKVYPLKLCFAGGGEGGGHNNLQGAVVIIIYKVQLSENG